LFTARARYGKTSLLTGATSDLAGNRGQHAYIKLLTSQAQYKEYLSGTTSRDLTYKNLIGPGSTVAEMADLSNRPTAGYDKFLLTNVSCQMTEKVQITEVFGDSEVIYYFGRQPLIFSFSGILIDSPDNNWFVEWVQMFSEIMRGSQLARNYEMLRIVLPNMAITGTMSAFSWNQDASRDTDIQFSFQFIAKVVEPIAATNTGMVTSNQLGFVDFSKVANFMGQSAINSLKGQMASLTSTIQNPTASLRSKGAALGQLGSGVGGAFGSMLSSGKDTLLGAKSAIDGWTKSENSYFDSIRSSALFQTVTSSLTGIRTSLFSPIYGILSSLSKLVSNTFNSAKSIFSAIISPIRNILRDITNISKQAIALVNLVNSSIKGFGRYVTGELRGLSNDYKTAIKTMGKAAGTIATAPVTVSHSIATMFSTSSLSYNAPFLKVTPKLTSTRPSLTVGKSTATTKIALLSGMTKYNPKTSNSL